MHSNKEECPLKGLSTQTLNVLRDHIRDGEFDKFKQNYNNEIHTLSNEDKLILLVDAIIKGAHKILDLIVDHDLDIWTAVVSACECGNWYALETLLQHLHVTTPTDGMALSCTVQNLDLDPREEFCDYWKCFYILVESPKIDINSIKNVNSTALHEAVRYHNNKAILELLKRGASLCVRDHKNELPLRGLKPAVLETHFDTCITSNNYGLNNKRFAVLVVYKNFENYVSSEKSSTLAPLAFMAENKEFRYLLKHPIITTMLYLKWHKLCSLIYMNVLLYLFFAISMITHAVIKYRETEFQKAEQISLVCCYIGIGYLILRELLQFVMAPLKYLRSLTNYVELLVIVCSLLTCHNWSEEHKNKYGRNIAVLCILLVNEEMVTIFKEHEAKEQNNNHNDENYFHKFPNLLVGFTKIIVMLTGEIEADKLNLGDNYLNYLLFLSFIFFISIILFNLLNGLAVSDTQAIRKEAKLNDIICRMNTLRRVENYGIWKISKLCRFNKPVIFLISKKFRFSFNKHLSVDGNKFAIMPNDRNKIMFVSDRDEFFMKSNTLQQVQLGRRYSCLKDTNFKMDDRIVRQLMKVLYRKSEENTDRLEIIERQLSRLINLHKPQ
ncbi:transient receptor potential cation channel protein painless-like [Cochliomyia hominivorax]